VIQKQSGRSTRHGDSLIWFALPMEAEIATLATKLVPAISTSLMRAFRIYFAQ